MNESHEVTGAATRRRWLGVGGLLGAGVLAGAILAGTGIAGAASSSSASSGAQASTSAPAHMGGDPAAMTHGPGETLLTGADASAVTTAAQAAVQGATVIRVETDSNGGATYEAHMQKADGSYVTVQFDGNLKVTGTIDGFGAGGPSAGSTP
jgi:hypothetical protein